MLIVGSVALSVYTDTDRTPKDIDIFGGREEIVEYFSGYNKSEFSIQEKPEKIIVRMKGGEIYEASMRDTSKELSRIVLDRYPSLPTAYGIPCAPPEVLYAVKMSHRFLKNSVFFHKTRDDIKFLRSRGYIEIPEFLKDWYKRREKETYDYGHPSLAKSKSEFFTDEYKYDHDSLHMAVKHLEHPAYWYFKPADKQVWCDKGMWDELDQVTKLLAVLEESYVLALERSQIPYNFEPSPKKSFDTALKKVCTSITSGWFREFAWENYDTVQSMYSDKYIDMFNHGLATGVVK